MQENIQSIHEKPLSLPFLGISRCEEPTTFTGGPFHAGSALHNLKETDGLIFSLGETWRPGVIPDYSGRAERLLQDQPSKKVLPQIFQSGNSLRMDGDSLCNKHLMQECQYFY